MPWAGFDTLRHTCASMLFRAGWNAKQVQVVAVPSVEPASGQENTRLG